MPMGRRIICTQYNRMVKDFELRNFYLESGRKIDSHMISIEGTRIKKCKHVLPMSKITNHNTRMTSKLTILSNVIRGIEEGRK